MPAVNILLQRFPVYGLSRSHNQACEQCKLFWRDFDGVRIAQNLLSLQIEREIAIGHQIIAVALIAANQRACPSL
ncbi:hypothetical protein D3C72_2337630 [compost metagenome]